MASNEFELNESDCDAAWEEVAAIDFGLGYAESDSIYDGPEIPDEQ